MTVKVKLIRDYASWVLAECGGEDETPGAIVIAIVEAQNQEEIEHLGCALLARNESLADADYRYGGKNYDPCLKAIADVLGWTA